MATKKAAVKKAAAKKFTSSAASDNNEIAQYTVMQPFKYHGTIVKPGFLIELGVAEAERLQADGLIGNASGEEIPDSAPPVES